MSVYKRNNDSRRFGSSSGAVVAIPLVLFAVGISAQKCIHHWRWGRGSSPFSSIVANKDDLESQDDVLVTSFSGNETKLISKQRKIPLIPTEIRWGGSLSGRAWIGNRISTVFFVMWIWISQHCFLMTFQERCLGFPNHPYSQQSMKMASHGDPMKICQNFGLKRRPGWNEDPRSLSFWIFIEDFAYYFTTNRTFLVG